MDRRPVMRNLAAAVGGAVLALALAACPNTFDIVGAVTNQVKQANNKFLVVTASGPFAANDQTVSPGTTIWVQFDRDLDTSSIGPQAAAFVPSQSWTWSYNPTTRTLTILPSSLESLTTYTVTVGNGLKGTDGNNMQTNYSVSFHTKQAPSGTMTINSGSSAYTQNGVVTLNFSYSVSTYKMRWSTNHADLTANYLSGITWQPLAPSVTGYDLGADGPKTVYYQFIDAANNVTAGDDGSGSLPLSASIVVDHLPPTGGGSFAINSGAVYAATTSVTLTSAVSDATSSVEMRVQNFADGTTWGPWQDYSAALAWNVSSPGTRVVNVQFRDKAGNSDGVTYSDAIIAGAPTFSILMNYHGYAPVGQIYSSWSINAPDIGTDTYWFSWRFPGGGWNLYTSTTAASLTVSSATEVILEFAVQIGNPSAGAFDTNAAPYSNVSPGFTSNITIVYNDGDATDTALANTIKGVLKNSPEWKAANSITGTMPSWSVTLIPQSFVSTVYGSYNRIYGYPLIVTPGITNYGNGNWVKNLLLTGKGLMLMGAGGARMLDTINAYWAKFYPKGGGQQPVDIGYAKSATTAANGYLYSRTLNNTVWSVPLYYSTIYPDLTYYLISYTALQRTSVYWPSPTVAPAGGWLYATDQNQSYYNTIQQGRFLQFGFQGLPDRVPYAYPWFVNLVNRMSDAYYP